jgi:AGCS family alanine or glycine:cation symporter
MEDFSIQIGEVLKDVSSFIWGWPMIIMLLGTHLYLTFRLKFPQRKIFTAIKLSVKRDKKVKSEGDVSPFAALATALAATIGTGNIIGVATAIQLGGAGAVLWCWLTGIFGMSTKYAESLLSVKYRVKTSDGKMLGGPMYTLERGLNMKWLGVVFAVFTAIAAFGIGNTVQANAISENVAEIFGSTDTQTIKFIVGVVLALLVGVVIIGGVKSISKMCTAIVPFMALFYILGCVIILCINYQYVGKAISLICEEAFSFKAVGGGTAGTIIMVAARYGIARGLFSNESGMGSEPIVAAAAQTRNPVRQALVSASGVFWDTVVICALTGLVIVSAIVANPGIEDEPGLLTKKVFETIPYVGMPLLSFGILTFAFSTILGWSYYGERAMEYLVGKKSIKYYRVAWVILVFIGSIMGLGLVWDLAEIMNALMALPNLISLILLSGILARDTQHFLWNGNLDQEINQEEL